jgi:hypothetical protein
MGRKQPQTQLVPLSEVEGVLGFASETLRMKLEYEGIAVTEYWDGSGAVSFDDAAKLY